MRKRLACLAGMVVLALGLISVLLADDPPPAALSVSVTVTEPTSPVRIAVGTSTTVKFKASLDAHSDARTEAEKSTDKYEWWVYITPVDADGNYGTAVTYDYTSHNSDTLDFSHEYGDVGTWKVCAECYVTAKVDGVNQSADGTSVNATIKAIGVDHLEVSGPKVDIPINQAVSLQAFPKPLTETFPDCQPVWQLEAAPAGAPPLNNPAPTGASLSYTPDRTGGYVFRATCGAGKFSWNWISFFVVGSQPRSFPPGPGYPPHSYGSYGAISISADPNMLKAGDSTVLSARVTDSRGATLPGIDVTFTADDIDKTTKTAKTGTGDGGTTKGVATQTWGPLQQTTSFTASAPGYGYDTCTVTVVLPNSPTITLKAVESTIMRGDSSTLTATVKDGNGNLMPGVPVTITHDGVTDGTPPTGPIGSTSGIATLNVFPTTTTLYTATANGVSTTARVTVQIPANSLQITDRVWGGSKADSDDSPDSPAAPLAVGPKTLGPDADQLAKIKIALLSDPASAQFPWVLVGKANGSIVTQGILNAATSAVDWDTLAPGQQYSVGLSKAGDPVFCRVVAIDVPQVDLQAYATGQPVGEDKEETPGVSLSSSGTKVLVRPTCITGANGAVIYSRKVTWDNPDKVIVEKMQAGQPTTVSSPLDLASTDAEVELRVRPTAGMSQSDTVTFSLKVSSAGSSTFEDRILAHRARVDVLSVPKYLFASAEYWTPVKFQVFGYGSKVTISQIAVSFDAGDGIWRTVQNAISCIAIADTSVAANHDSDTYTCFIPPSAYSSISLPTHVSTQARFKVQVTCSSDGHTSSSEQSDEADAEAAPKRFSDTAVVAYDLRTSQVDRLPAASISRDRFQGINAVPTGVDKNGLIQTTHYRGNPTSRLGYPNDCWDEVTCNTVFPHPHSGLDAGDPNTVAYNKGAMEAFIQIDASTTGLSRLKVSHQQWVTEDSGTSAEAQAYQVSAYGRRMGVVFFISYGGRNVQINGAATRVMDLVSPDPKGCFDFSAFTTGEAVITLSNNASATTGFQLGSAASTIAGALIPTGWVSTTFGVLSGICDAVTAWDGVTQTGPDQNADVDISGWRQHWDGDGNPYPKKRLWSAPRSGSVLASYALAETRPGACPGEQYAYWLDLNAYTTNVNTPHIGLGQAVTMTAEAVYRFTAPTDPLKLNDFRTYTIDAWR